MSYKDVCVDFKVVWWSYGLRGEGRRDWVTGHLSGIKLSLADKINLGWVSSF